MCLVSLNNLYLLVKYAIVEFMSVLGCTGTTYMTYGQCIIVLDCYVYAKIVFWTLWLPGVEVNSYWQTRLMVNYFTHVLLILRSGFILHTLSKPVGFITPPPPPHI